MNKNFKLKKEIKFKKCQHNKTENIVKNIVIVIVYKSSVHPQKDSFLFQ